MAKQKTCDAAWCPECRCEMAKADEDFCCLGCGASLIPLFGASKQRELTAEAIAIELDQTSIHGNAAVARKKAQREK